MNGISTINQSISKNGVGRKTVFTNLVLQKLREAFLIGCTDEEACIYADISPASLYNYQKAHPEYLEQKVAWRKNPIIKAKNTIFNNLTSPETARWYLERKSPDEFGQKFTQLNQFNQTNVYEHVSDTNILRGIEELFADPTGVHQEAPTVIDTDGAIPREVQP